jgi:Mrp family chromosome partitioning ATPase
VPDVSGLLDEGGLLPVLTAVAAPSIEAELVAGFARPELGILVVRRCVDLVELLGAAPVGTARAALVSADLRGLDRESLTQLKSHGLAIVGLAADEPGERLLYQLGARFVVPEGAAPEQVAGALRAAALAGPEAPARTFGSTDVFDGAPLAPDAAALSAAGEQRGRVLAVWGPAGAPGRSTVALGLADALAAAGVSVLLVDADPYGGCLATLTGLLDESPGLAAACRAANAGLLDVPRLAECCRAVGPGLRVLTGLADPGRWPELRAPALEVVLDLARRIADVTVVDCGFSLEEDEALSFDTAAPRRNAATLTALRGADHVLAVGSADPVGLSRLIGQLPRLQQLLDLPELTPPRVHVVANRLRDGLLPGNPQRQVEQVFARHAGTTSFAAIPLDTEACDAAHGHGQLPSEASPDSAVCAAFAALAAVLIPATADSGPAVPRRRRRGFGRHRQERLAAR